MTDAEILEKIDNLAYFVRTLPLAEEEANDLGERICTLVFEVAKMASRDTEESCLAIAQRALLEIERN